MKDIRIYFLHPLYNDISFLYEHLLIPRDKYNLIWDDTNPDYLVVSEWIYKDVNLYRQFLKLANNRTINIFYGGEAMAPDLNWFDYAIAFDRNLKCYDRIIRMPTIDFFHKRLTPDFWIKCPDARDELKHKTKFCNFIYTNPNAHPMRDRLFYAISQYKPVDALGTHLRNVESAEKFVDERVKRNYKFTIASENATYRGYTSEKLLTALQAYTIPIYWGDPSVADSFNPKRFINANEMSLDEVLEKIKQLDSNDDLYCKMLSEPVMTADQEEKYRRDHKLYLDWWDNLFAQDIDSAKRLGFGTYPNMNRNFKQFLVESIDAKPKNKLMRILFGQPKKFVCDKPVQ